MLGPDVTQHFQGQSATMGGTEGSPLDLPTMTHPRNRHSHGNLHLRVLPRPGQFSHRVRGDVAHVDLMARTVSDLHGDHGNGRGWEEPEEELTHGSRSRRQRRSVPAALSRGADLLVIKL